MGLLLFCTAMLGTGKGVRITSSTLRMVRSSTPSSTVFHGIATARFLGGVDDVVSNALPAHLLPAHL